MIESENEMKKSIVTGVYGQDGSFICELLAKKKYKIFGIAKQELSANSLRVKQELDNVGIDCLVCNIDLYDFIAVSEFIKQIQPDVIFHMAAYHVSSEGEGNGKAVREQEVFNKNVQATANILEACYLFSKHTKIITAGSCLMYDASKTNCQSEKTLYASKSLYGLAKITENKLVAYYREKGIFACTAILYNHESHRRASQFVTKKIVENMVKIKKGKIDSFTLGSLDAQKDWGYAGDYANAMYLMSQADFPRDYIVASGEMHTIGDFVEKCAEILDIINWKEYIKINENIISRKTEGRLLGKAALIEKELNWKPEFSFTDLVAEMVNYEIQLM